MSAESPLIVRTWPVGGFTATLTVPRVNGDATASAVIEWTPSVPSRLTEQEVAQYRAGRNRALAEVAQLMGGNVALLEL